MGGRNGCFIANILLAALYESLFPLLYGGGRRVVSLRRGVNSSGMRFSVLPRFCQTDWQHFSPPSFLPSFLPSPGAVCYSRRPS